MPEIEFLRDFPRSRVTSRLRCSEAVAAHWRTALAGLDSARYQSMAAHLREAVLEAAGSPERARALTDEGLVAGWSARQREAYAALLDAPASSTIPRDVWGLFGVAFDAIATLQRPKRRAR